MLLSCTSSSRACGLCHWHWHRVSLHREYIMAMRCPVGNEQLQRRPHRMLRPATRKRAGPRANVCNNVDLSSARISRRRLHQLRPMAEHAGTTKHAPMPNAWGDQHAVRLFEQQPPRNHTENIANNGCTNRDSRRHAQEVGLLPNLLQPHYQHQPHRRRLHIFFSFNCPHITQHK